MPVTRQVAAGRPRSSAGSAMEAESGGARATLQRTAGNFALQHLLRGPSTRPDPQASIQSELAGHGEPLDEGLRAQIEQGAGSRLGDVRIHRDAHAARAAKDVNARAFTVGNHIVFGPGAFQTDSSAGKRLLAHELAHVLHQPVAASLALVPPGSRAEQQASEGRSGAGAPASAAPTGGMARAVEKNLTDLSDAELWAEYDLARKSVASQPPGPDYDAAVEYVREIEDAVRARGASATAAPQGPEEVNFSKANPEVAGAEQAPYTSGKTPLGEGDIDRYGAYNTAYRTGDELEGHEVLQNSFLKATAGVVKRGKGAASRGNPSLAVGKELHGRITAEQGKLGLKDPARLAKMSDEEVIEANVRALENAGVEHSQIQVIKREALAYARKLPNPPPGTPVQQTSSGAAQAGAAPPATEQNFTPANPEQLSSTPAAAENFTPGPKPAATALPPEESLTPAAPPPALEKAPAAVEINPAAPKPNVGPPPVPEVVEPVAPPPAAAPAVVAPAEGVAASEAAAAVRPPLGSPKLGAAAGAAGVALNVVGIALMARDMKIEQSGYVGRVGEAVLEDEHGEYTVQPTGGFLYGHGKKTYVSGDRKGQTVDLGFWDMRREYKKRDEKYGYIDWKGDFVPGRVPPVYVPRPGLDTA